MSTGIHQSALRRIAGDPSWPLDEVMHTTRIGDVVFGRQQQFIPSMLDGWHPGMAGTHITITRQDKDNDMANSWTNPDAAEIARDILRDKTKGALRGRVEAAVEALQALVSDTQCGSTLTFMKTLDGGGHYFYAAVKNGDKWYTTANNPRVIQGDDDFITWLIGLEIYETDQIEIAPSAHLHALPVETTATES